MITTQRQAWERSAWTALKLKELAQAGQGSWAAAFEAEAAEREAWMAYLRAAVRFAA